MRVCKDRKDRIFFSYESNISHFILFPHMMYSILHEFFFAGSATFRAMNSFRSNNS